MATGLRISIWIRLQRDISNGSPAQQPFFYSLKQCKRHPDKHQIKHLAVIQESAVPSTVPSRVTLVRTKVILPTSRRRMVYLKVHSLKSIFPSPAAALDNVARHKYPQRKRFRPNPIIFMSYLCHCSKCHQYFNRSSTTPMLPAIIASVKGELIRKFLLNLQHLISISQSVTVKKS